MNKTHTITVLLALALLGLSAAPAWSLDLRVEVSPMVSFPIARLLDGLPIEATVMDDYGTTTDAVFLTDLSQGVGGGVGISVLLNDWEIRYELAALPYSRLHVTHVKLPDYTGDFYLPYGESVDASGELDELLFHNIVLGYRFTPFDWVVHPYFPFGLGFSAAQTRLDDETLFGFNIQIGVGVQWDVTEAFRVGTALRYTFSAYKNPDTSLSSLQSVGMQSAATNTSLFEAVMETMQTLSWNLHASYQF